MRFASRESGSTWLQSRRLIAPEPLEPRNAPSTLLPWSDVLASPLADQGDWFADLKLTSDAASTAAVARPVVLWTPLTETRSAGEQDLGIIWTDEVFNTVQQPATTTLDTTQLPATTVAYEAAAIDTALEKAGGEEQVPPPVIQPVIMDPDSPFNQPDFGQLVRGQ